MLAPIVAEIQVLVDDQVISLGDLLGFIYLMYASENLE